MRGMAREYAAGKLGQLQAGSQAGSGMARSRAMARVNWVPQDQCWAKTRRPRVLVVTVRSARPMRAVQLLRYHHRLGEGSELSHLPRRLVGVRHRLYQTREYMSIMSIG